MSALSLKMMSPGYFDFSKEHILDAVDNSLRRLHTDYLHALLLHRPDTLMEPEEVAEAFDRLDAYSQEFFKTFLSDPKNMENLKSEFFIPLMVDKLINGRCGHGSEQGFHDRSRQHHERTAVALARRNDPHGSQSGRKKAFAGSANILRRLFRK